MERKYEELMNKSDECLRKALKFYNKKDYAMSKFYKNASVGFRTKALKLILN